jgi:hypothetical protein
VASSTFFGLGATRMQGLSLAQTAPMAMHIAFADGEVEATAGVADSTLTGTVEAGTLSFTAGSSSTYLLGNYTIGSPSPMTRVDNGDGTQTTTIPAMAGSVTFDNDHSYLVLSSAPIVWTTGHYPGTGGMFIQDGSSLVLQVQFLSGGRVQLSDPVNNLDATKNWTDADVQAALKQVTQ